MQYRSQKRTLCTTEEFELSCEIVRGKLYLQLQVMRNSQICQNQLQKKYTKLFCLAYHAELKKHFKTIMYLIDHLKDKNNFQIDQNQGIITVYQVKGKLKKNPQLFGSIQLQEITLGKSKDRIIKNLFNIKKKQSNVICSSMDKEKYGSEKEEKPKSNHVNLSNEGGAISKMDATINNPLQDIDIQSIIDMKIDEIRQEHKRTTKKLRKSIKAMEEQIKYLRKKLTQKQNLLQAAQQKMNSLKMR